jgi:hypothetical protein
MRVVEYNMLPNGADTKTMQDLGAVLGQKPHMSKAVVTLFPHLSLQKLTEQLGSVYVKQGVENLKSIDAFSFEWNIKTNQIPRIKFAEDASADANGGEGIAEFRIVLERKFYDPHDTFELDNEQQLYVTRVPKQLAPDKWEHWVKLVSPDPSKKANLSYMTRGSETKYISNYHPELSEKGYSKFMYNIEKHRNYISRHRVGDSISGDFAKLKPRYLEHAGVYFQMATMEKDLLDQIYLSFENSMLLGHGNFDDKGNCLITEEDGRPIPIGEGVIPQVKRYCGQQRYFSLNEQILRNAINDVVDKLEKKDGNNIVMVCNWRFYQQAQTVLDNLLKTRATDNYFYTVKGQKIQVGAEYNAYHFAGNTLTFMHNTALTDRYPDRGYALFLDTSMYDGEANIQMITLANMSLFKGSLKGMGGLTGGESGDIASTIHGSRLEYMGYRGAKVANPYGAHILEENIIY